MEKDKPKDTFTIDNLDALRAVADPLRTQMLETLALQPLTVKQVADQLGLSPNKLYYHINLLEKYGLVVVAETRMVGNMQEKIYTTTAEKYNIDPSLLDFSTQQGQANISDVLASTIDLTREDLQRSLDARAFELEKGAEKQPRQALVTRVLSRLPEACADEFMAKLQTIIEEFTDSDVDPKLRPASDAPETLTYALTVALYPRYTFPEG